MREMTQAPMNTLDAILADLPMVTLKIMLAVAEHNLTVVVPESEWAKLINDFKRMPVDECQRVGASIRNATAVDPFPLDGGLLDARAQEVCDAFISDCMLLAALAEAVGQRVLTDTVVDGYQVVRGNLARQGFN